MEQDFNLEQTLLDFNQDSNFIELRERYSTRSFLEIMSVERSENRHSSFLAWLLEAKDFAVNPKDHPIVHLLDILIRRKRDQNTDCPKISELRDIVLARDIKDIKLLEKISTEKTVGDATSNPNIYGKIADRLDIYIKVALTSLQGEEHVFEIIIENKVGSTEGLPKKNEEKKWPEGYAEKYQTERYYAACQSNDRIFVFLTPISTQELDRFNDIHEVDKKSREPHFININYQDLLDEVIEPLWANKNLSQRVSILLEEYILSLSLPGQYTDDDKKLKSAIIMAERKQDVETIKKLFENGSKYKPLILSAAKCLSNEDDIQNMYKNWPKQPAAINKRCEKLKEAIRSSLDFPVDDNENFDMLQHTYLLLVSFGKTYKNLFIAFLKSYIENQDSKAADETLSVIKETYQSLTGAPKDRSEFIVISPDGTEEKDSKRNFAEFIIRQYIQYYHKVGGITDPHTYFYIKDDYPLCKDITSKDNTRYCIKKAGDFYISNQWGITINQDKWKTEQTEENLGSIDRILFKIYGQALIDLKEGKTYSTSPKDKEEILITPQSPWDNILSGYTIKVKRVVK